MPDPPVKMVTSAVKLSELSLKANAYAMLKVRRLMDEDNKKMRRAARREFQENVRSLVAFVRKRDRRVAAWQQQEELKKQERLAAEERR